MKISILFNWPPGKNSARATVCRESLEDSKYNFQVGIVAKGERDIKLVKSDPIINDDEDEVCFCVERGDRIVVDLFTKSGEQKREIWDTDEKWPAEAYGASSTEVPWYFG